LIATRSVRLWGATGEQRLRVILSADTKQVHAGDRGQMPTSSLKDNLQDGRRPNVVRIPRADEVTDARQPRTDRDSAGKSFRFGVEQRGIDFIPATQRYGTPRRLFTVWFSVNSSILSLTVGTLGINAGLPFAWTCLALTVGTITGTFFMAAHSAQGPRLGIPQMIQSRAQFGVLGAGLPLMAVLASNTLYSSANAILIQDTIRLIAPVTGTAAIVLFGAVTVLLAFMGYELIHRLAVALTLLSGVLFVSVAILLIVHGKPATGAGALDSHFSIASFILVVTQATAWSLSSGPTVADYSRYLPANVRASTTFWYTGLGNFFSSAPMMVLGAWLAASFPDLASHAGLGIAQLFGRGQHVAAFLIIVNLLQVNVMLLYSAYMSSTTIITGLRGMSRVPLGYKFLVMSLLMTVSTVIAFATQNRFNEYFSDLLAMLVYTLIPWSAINLADYYVVCRGIYSIEDVFRLDGIYGRYRWRTIAIYLFSILVQVPFVSLSFYVGPLARLIGADIAWLPGLLVAAGLYCLFERAVSLPADGTLESPRAPT
jgi:nucleobase:cation symporter-1, NCS1 family